MVRCAIVMLRLSALAGLGVFLITPLSARKIQDVDGAEEILRSPRTCFEFLMRDSAAARKMFSGDPTAAKHWCWRIRLPDIEVELAELKEALHKHGIRGLPCDRILGAYYRYRTTNRGKQDQPNDLPPHQRIGDDFSSWEERLFRWHWPGDPEDHPSKLPLSGPEDYQRIPLEFRLYAEGAREFWKERIPQARAKWQELLELPENQRPYRSVWATWMLAKTEPDLSKARPLFEQTVSLSERAGMRDGLYLGNLAAGWLAPDPNPGQEYVAFNNAQFPRLLEGSSRALALVYKKIGYGQRFDHQHEAGHTKFYAADPVTRTVILSSVFCYRGLNSRYNVARLRAEEAALPTPRPWGFEDFLHEIAARTDHLPGEKTDLAGRAYDAGRYELAHTLLEKETAPRAQTKWLKAKIAVHQERFHHALSHFESLKADFRNGSPHSKNAWSWSRRELAPRVAFYGVDLVEDLRRGQYWEDLGQMRLHFGNLEGALAAFLEGYNSWWSEYILQHVMTTKEAKVYVDRYFPRTEKVVMEGGNGDEVRHHSYGVRTYEYPLANFVRHTFARRLMAEGNYHLATRYFGKDYRGPAHAIADFVAQGRDKARSNQERAQALWDAARIFYTYSRFFGVVVPAPSRIPVEQWPDQWRMNVQFPECLGSPTYNPEPAFPPPSTKETSRLAANNWSKNYRGHPWFDAARLADEAAALLPRNNELAATMLCDAGCWLEDDFPKWADDYYKKLVRRHPNIELAQQADRKRWFPKAKWQAHPERDEKFLELLKERSLPMVGYSVKPHAWYSNW